MSLLQAIVLGIVQGLTEFLPISSSGHLILVPWLLGWNVFHGNQDLNKTFDVALHLGTFVAALAYFRREIVVIVRAWLRSLARRSVKTPDERLAWLLLISTIPAGLVGVAFESFVEDRLGQPWLICIMMVGFGLVMLAVDMTARARKDMGDLRYGGALGIGVAQAIALAPGVSRSGITMVTGLLIGLDRESAARYSFLLSVPVVGGAALLKLGQLAANGMPAHMLTPFIAGTVAAAISGLAAIWFLLDYLRKHTFAIFVAYRLIVGVALLLVIVAGLRPATGI
jgi:undecaprenyl-diphosphatase